MTYSEANGGNACSETDLQFDENRRRSSVSVDLLKTKKEKADAELCFETFGLDQHSKVIRREGAFNCDGEDRRHLGVS